MSAIRQVTTNPRSPLVGLYCVDLRARTNGRVIEMLDNGSALVEEETDLRILARFDATRFYRDKQDWQVADTAARERWRDAPVDLGSQRLTIPTPATRSRPRLVTPLDGNVN